MEKYFLTPNRGSQGGTALARALGVTRLTKKRQATFEGSQDKLIINWGNSNPIPEVMKCRILNNPEAVASAVNKLESFKRFQHAGVPIPTFTVDEEKAKAMVRRGAKVFARHTLVGSGGEGIQVLTSEDEFPCKAPLYTAYIPKKSEFRLHVFRNDVFDMQRKMRRRDIPDEEVNWLVRNHNNGFVFGRSGNEVVPDVQWLTLANVAKRAVQALGLDFGAVDVIWNEGRQQAYVLEVNTSPGLEGQTINNYNMVFDSYLRKMNNNYHVKKDFNKVNFNDLAKVFNVPKPLGELVGNNFKMLKDEI